MNARLQDKRRPIDWQQVRSGLALAAETMLREERPSPEAAAELLARRARALEQPLERGSVGGDFSNIVAFTLGAERYGIEMEWIREVVRFTDLTPVPGAPALVAGMINYRGEIVAVIDLRELFGIKASGLVDMLSVIVVGSERAEFGVLASRVLETVSVHGEELARSPLEAVGGAGGELVKGIARDALVVLDGQRLLTDRRLFVDECENAGV
jgi:purine-binding chemotaxis protein CheW